MKYILTTILFFVIVNCRAQQTNDSVVFSQDHSSLFSNVYCFYSNKTFLHEFRTDDFGLIVGKGKFVDRGKKRILYFTSFDTTEYTRENFGWRKFEMNQTRKLKFSKDSFKCKDYHNTTKSKKVRFSKMKPLTENH